MANNKHKVNELQEAWEEVELKIMELLHAGHQFERAARQCEVDDVSNCFKSYFLNGVENFHTGFSVIFSQEQIASKVEDMVQQMLEEDE